MAGARLDSVSKFICEAGDWKVSNLQIQKILYMAQMYHMGEHDGERLVDTGFEAWDYGPVSPELYHKVKGFGSGAIRNVFFNARGFLDEDPRKNSLKAVCDALIKRNPGELVEITHWEKGAWAKHYIPNARHISIPDEDILQEYKDRISDIGSKA